MDGGTPGYYVIRNSEDRAELRVLEDESNRRSYCLLYFQFGSRKQETVSP
jgi:hypothetical protein